jgi:DNA topoisomerase-1
MMMMDDETPSSSDEGAPKKKTPAKKAAKAKPKAGKTSASTDAGDGDGLPAKKKAGTAKKAAPAKKVAKKTAAKKAASDDEEEAAEGGKPAKKTGKKAATKKTAVKKKAGRRNTLDFEDGGFSDGSDVEPVVEGGEDEAGEGGGRALVVVESPAKAKTINKFLGKDFRVMASMGHVRDLVKKDLGIDIENDFEPNYEPIAEKKKVIGELRRYAANAREIYLACDPDREGEAIAWHIRELLPASLRKRTSRVTFNQITKDAVQKAFEKPRDIEMNRVNAQQARRVLDRIVGFKLSQLLWKKVRRGLSAGRVQSVAVRLIVEREQEIRAFKPVEHWQFATTLDAPRLHGLPVPPPEEGADPAAVAQLPWRFDANLFRWRGEKLDPDSPTRIASAEQAREVERLLTSSKYVVRSVEQKERRNNPKNPFITSTLQQAGSGLGYGAQRTMRIAQGLYEGVTLGEEGAVGLITYMRTDSVSVAPEAIAEVREYIGKELGAQYLPETPVIHKRKAAVAAQEAHEAIRPSSVLRTPESVRQYLENDAFRLYQLIWRRFVASQMMPARYMQMTVEVSASHEGEDVGLLRATGSRLLFDGHLRVSGREQNDTLLPAVEEKEALDLVPPVRTEQKFTEPPSRYTEASLVKKLEELGIGRPSTYATIIQTIQDRGYVTQPYRSNSLQATKSGEVVTTKLMDFFTRIMDYGYTRNLEIDLDRVEGAVVAGSGADSDGGADETVGGAIAASDDVGETLPALDWRELLRGFYQDFSRDLDVATEKMPRVNDNAPVTDTPCPKCGAMMQKITNTKDFSQFLGCPRYPECKTIIALDDSGNPAPVITAPCPKCGNNLVVKSGSRGRFFACEGYPECKQTFEIGPDNLPLPKPDVEAPCPNCKTPMLVRKGRSGYFLGCPTYPKCRGTLPLKQDAEGNWIVGEKGQRQEMPQVDVKCEACGKPMVIKRSRRGPFLACTGYPKCKATGKLPEGIKLPEKAKPALFGEDCKQCGKPLVIREGRRGPFVSCSGYPECRNTRNLPEGAVLPGMTAAPSP